VIDNLRAVGGYSPLADSIAQNPLSSFYPFLDSLGQYRHRQWPGKTPNLANRLTTASLESAAHAALSLLPGRDRFGGYADGPQLAATGHFRVVVYENRQWLVSPDGYLFWSHGLGGVSLSQPTEALGKTHWFASLPPVTMDGRTDFLLANAVAKWGGLMGAKEAVYKRLSRWGINTLATGSSPDFTLDRRVPYTVSLLTSVNRSNPRMDDTLAIRNAMNQSMVQNIGLISACEADPFCLGYFVDGELDFLSTLPPGEIGFHAERYYRIVSEALKQASPNKLYLGSRIVLPRTPGTLSASTLAWLKAADASCDVISFKPATYSLFQLALPDSLKRPLLISRFGFGARDRGLDHPGYLPVTSQEQRARLYLAWVRDVMADARFIGAHWFQYADQPFSGITGGSRPGECAQTGFIDIADKPYPEMEAAVRALSLELYPNRLAGRRGEGQAVSFMGHRHKNRDVAKPIVNGDLNQQLNWDLNRNTLLNGRRIRSAQTLP
jgi:hypothetical protein